LAAELEEAFGESAEIIKSSGGVFEVQDKGRLIFSKKALGRFPEQNEVLGIVQAIDSGVSVEEAQRVAAQNAPHTPSFMEWFKGLISGSAPQGHS
jgi:selenoprotein W-related protein